eukprot:scaffold1336_cov158-Cylindrotheca_fusiformis.AAC.12
MTEGIEETTMQSSNGAARDYQATSEGYDYHLVGTSHGFQQDPPGKKGFVRSTLEQDQFIDEGADSIDDHLASNNYAGSHSHEHIGSARTPWYGTTTLLLSEVMGTGVLSLPFAARTLGWFWTIVAVPLFAVVATYSGWLLASVKKEYLDVGSYADASTEFLGLRAGVFTRACMLVNWGAIAIYYLIALAEGIGELFNDSLKCSYERSRDFFSISKYLSGPSTMAVLILLAIVLVNLLNHDHGPFGESTTFGTLPETSMLDFLEALSAFVFAYQGQTIYLELISEMKEPNQFPKACSLAYFVMCAVYGLTVVVAYGIKGADTPEFLPDSVPSGLAQRFAGALVALHITVSYVIACQPLHDWLHQNIFPSTYHEESTLGSIHWFLITGGYLVFGFIVGNLIPFFADVQALIGSLFGAPTIFGWPAIFYLVLCRRKTSSWKEAVTFMGYGHAATCVVFLFVCTPLFCVLGTTGAIQSIVEDTKMALRPFQCSIEDRRE